MNGVERVARAIQHRDYERNPTWGGEDAWEQIAQYKRDDYLAMAQAAIDATPGWLWRLWLYVLRRFGLGDQ